MYIVKYVTINSMYFISIGLDVPSKKDYSLLINAYNNIFIFIHLFLMIKTVKLYRFCKSAYKIEYLYDICY